MQKTQIFMISLLVLLAPTFFSGCRSEIKDSEIITLGALLPLTGEDADEGLRAMNGLSIAVDEINENGGILGKKLDVITLNDQGDPKIVVEQYKALKEKNVAAIIGSSYSKASLALSNESQADQIPIVTPTSTNPDVTINKPNYFRAIFIDDYQAEIMAKFAIESLGAKKAVVMYSEDNAAFPHLAAVFTNLFEEKGGVVASIEVYNNKITGFREILDKYKDNPPDVIFCPEYYAIASMLVKDVYDAGFTDTKTLGIDSWAGILNYAFELDALKNVYYAAPFSADDADPKVVQFVDTYFDTYNQLPLAGASTTYDSVYILKDAITRAGSVEKADVIKALKETNLDVLSGNIQYDQNNNPRPNVYVISIKDGKYSTYEKLSN